MSGSVPSQPETPVPAEIYDEEYYLGECEGFIEFAGGKISPRLLAGLEHLRIEPGERLLDVGCGRGEATLWAAEGGAFACGLDYSPYALPIARSRAAGLTGAGCMALLAANACVLPFSSGSFDYVVMMDIVEHLHPGELDQALREAHRVLREDGVLLVHTAPNIWYYRMGYPVFRLMERLRGRQLPKNPKARFRYHAQVHVNEQSPMSLRDSLRRAQFHPRVWVSGARTKWDEMGRLSRWAGRLAVSLPLLNWVVAGDIFAVATKQ